jgi:hypothetical protein
MILLKNRNLDSESSSIDETLSTRLRESTVIVRKTRDKTVGRLGTARMTACSFGNLRRQTDRLHPATFDCN